jgi:hypothetical protein
MHTNNFAMLVLVMSGLLLGCEKPPIGTAAQSSSPAISQTAPPAAATVPAVDPSLPSLEAASVKPKTGTDATADSVLTRTERDTKMPLPGQANDHSSPAVAKRGDTTEPVKSEK